MITDRAAASASSARPDDQTALRPYVPRLVVEWLRSSPDRLGLDVPGTD